MLSCFHRDHRSLRAVELVGEPRLCAAAQIIEEHTGTKGHVTAAALKRAGAALDIYEASVEKHRPVPRSGWPKLTPAERRVLREALPKLSERLHPPQKPGPLPFCTSFEASAIYDPDLSRAARVVAAFSGTANDLVTAEGLRRISEELRPHREGREVAELNRLLSDRENARVLTEENLDALSIFLESGKGRLLHAGAVAINGRRFEDVHRLPCSTTDPSALGKLIEDYEERFTLVRYDRIYVLTTDGELRVALNPSGPLHHIQPKLRAQIFEPNGHLGPVGNVLFVADISNSLREGTIGFWRQLGVRVATLFQQQFGQSIDERVKKTAYEVTNTPGGPKAETASPAWLMVGGLGAGLGAGIGALALSMPTVLGVVAGIALLMTAVSVIQSTRNFMLRDKGPIYHAMGITLARPDPVRI